MSVFKDTRVCVGGLVTSFTVLYEKIKLNKSSDFISKLYLFYSIKDNNIKVHSTVSDKPRMLY